MSNNRFDLAAPTEALGTSRLLYAARSRYGKEWHSTVHRHACTEIFYCVRGLGDFVLDGHRRTVGSDDVVIVGANVEHTESSSSANPLEYIVLGVDGLDFHFGGSDSIDSASYTVLNYRDEREVLLLYLEDLLRELEAKPSQYETVCTYLLQVLLIKLLRTRALPVSIEPARRGNRECAAARRYIDEHYAEPITLEALAELSHVNKYYLVHTFSKEYGITPINYLIDRRIRESKYLLSNTNHSLSQISHVLGFSSPSYFSQSFRRLTGISPMEYRKASREQASSAT